MTALAGHHMGDYNFAGSCPAGSDQSRSLDQWAELAEYSGSRAVQDAGWGRTAAFNLHQATETSYACFLLMRTLYFPRSHNIKLLRSLAKDSEPRLINVWPSAARLDRRRFELLKRAYVEARYLASYEISNDDLDALSQSVRALRQN
ncbi:hypothetical protein C1T17_08890 [Sphingobium sp. SCG-1]|uniref:HEPN domain-containing protein n=1 Tax=Sphingobium sp. SCG-1 TaxID=2072936 RepID=UPI000CD6794F|nr:HEPN domain-containing protein [Sphingobium sp. SCG-1]AUW58204.1 hypothetical protein C1T17_08890 [Sphingobium sp. SCG-1]